MIDARSLHGWLGTGCTFAAWMNRRVKEYGFADGKDFCSILTKSSGGRPRKDYLLTIDMAKELAMVERTDKGRETRPNQIIPHP